MSYVKKTSLVHYGDWDSNSDTHPAMKWMHAYTNKIDEGDWDSIWNAGNLVDKNFKYVKATGEVFQPGEESWKGVKDSYAFFTAYHHEPYFFTCWELDDNSGWAMTGNAWLYFNLPGEGDPALSVQDIKGKTWQGRVPGGFYFEYKKDNSGYEGIKISSTSITSDSGPVLLQLLKRGVITPAALGL